MTDASNIPVCLITGHIAGDPDACGDCDPCSGSNLVPAPVKRLIAEKESWREKYSEAASRLDDPAIASAPELVEALEKLSDAVFALDDVLNEMWGREDNEKFVAPLGARQIVKIMNAQNVAFARANDGRAAIASLNAGAQS